MPTFEIVDGLDAVAPHEGRFLALLSMCGFCTLDEVSAYAERMRCTPDEVHIPSRAVTPGLSKLTARMACLDNGVAVLSGD